MICYWHSMILSHVEPNKNLTSLGYILVGNILSGNNIANFHTSGDSPRGGLISRSKRSLSKVLIKTDQEQSAAKI